MSKYADQCNYQVACGLAQASDAMKILMNHAVAVSAISIADGQRVTLETSNASGVPGVRVIATMSAAGKKQVRAMWETCVLQWEETLCH
ncbi:MAG: hypothetical protein COW58_14355 [Thalassolituus sp. CG17_big_fil_post_rev_8_21_14_2_50_53_8]|nr:MAG: hypothetical protein COW58_14355 [Thalassolituus sp. CG17_big_fil_post_rev_8_21_14_2_50_53_8]